MKRLVICLDGTWNKPDQKDRDKTKPSNVVKMARGVLPESANGTPQIVYYDEGLGTHWGLDRFLGGGFGLGISKNILDAYRFLVHNYVPHDELYFFGFSRGAYTVRSLAGLINRIGLLPKDHAFFTPTGWAHYRQRSSQVEVDEFCQKHQSRTVRIKFVGVWDTVGALGIPVGIFKTLTRGLYEFHDVKLTSCIDHAFHAVAIDERRNPFSPTLWSGPVREDQVLEQVWFSGVHTNIGGGYDKDGLANIALHWLKEKATGLGLEFDEAFLKFYKPFFGHELRNSMKWYHRLLGANTRMIGTSPNGNESVHPDAIKRMEHDPSYKPENLIEYLKGHQED